MQKLYCYVDETGQDTEGEFFIVSVIITEEDRDDLTKILETIEQASGKGKVKWIKAKKQARIAYIEAVLSEERFKGTLNYGVHRDTKDYLSKTVLTTARAILAYVEGKHKATVLVDGLQKSQVRWFGKALRHLNVSTRKVSGVKKEETDALMRLADAIAGLTRAAILGREELQKLFEKARKEGYIKEV